MSDVTPLRSIGRPLPSRTSGSPADRRRSVTEIRDLAQRHGPEMIEALVYLARCSASDAVRLAAIKELLDRGYGSSALTITGENGEGPIMVVIRKGLGE